MPSLGAQCCKRLRAISASEAETLGTFDVTIGVGNLNGGDLVEVEAFVDTGATCTTVPASLLERLSVEPQREELVQLADGSTAVWNTGQARIAYEDQEWICPVNFGPEEVYLLGATALEIFDLMADPKEQRLVRRPPRCARPF